MFYLNKHLLHQPLGVWLVLNQLQLLVDQPGVGLHQDAPGLLPVHHDLIRVSAASLESSQAFL